MFRLFVSIVLVASALSVAVPPAAAATLIVCPSGCSYSTIQAAIDASVNGDTIIVRPGSYAGAINVNKDLTLCSTGSSSGGSCAAEPNSVTIDGAGSIYPVFISASGATLSGFTIQNPGFVTTDQSAGGPVDPSLVVVFGADNVQVLSNILQFPAAPLAPGSSRWITDGVNVAADAGGAKSDNVVISGNIFRHFVESVDAAGTCLTAPCRMAAIDLWGAGAAPQIAWNNMLLPPGRPDGAGGMTVGIWGNAANAVLRGNIVQPEGDVAAGLYGVKGTYQSSLFEENSFYGDLHGLFLAGSGLTIQENYFAFNNEALRITAKSSLVQDNAFELNNIAIRAAGPNGATEATGLVFRENRFTGNNVAFSAHAQLSGRHFDLRENDWGVYEREQIELFLDDPSGNVLDISCFIDSDGVTRVCPVASYTAVPSGASWPKTITLTDTSTFPGSEFASRAWTLPGPATSADAVVPFPANAPGAFTFTLSVTDGEGFTRSTTQTLFLTNAAPAFSLAASYPASEGSAFSLPLGATDADGDALAYTLTSGPTGASIANGILAFTPSYTQAGSHPVSISVTDGHATTSASTTIVVANVAAGPSFAAIPDLVLTEGTSGARSFSASSPAGAPVTLAATTLPAGAAFTDLGNGAGTVSFGPGAVGIYPVTIEATAEGVTVARSFNVVVFGTTGLAYTRVSSTIVQGSPGETVSLNGIVTNLGSGNDAFRITAASTRAGWTLATPANVALASGAGAPASVSVTIPANGDVTFVTVTACSVASPTTCKDLRWRVEVPLVVTVDLAPSFGLAEEIVGKVTVKFRDGTLAANVGVGVVEWSDEDLPFMESTVAGMTGANGEYAFELADPRAKLYGSHTVAVSASRGAVQNVTYDAYDVTL